MKDVLIQFLSNFKELTETQVEELANSLTVMEVKKQTTVVKIGQFCNLCYFVLRGCLRQYVIQDGIEKTTAIYTENQAINYYRNSSESSRSENFLTCIENSILLVGNPEMDKKMFARFPILVDITRKMIEADLLKTQKNLAKVIIATPEQRYLNLLDEKPELLQRVPQHIIASYLGMTPESLSRIKKRLSQKPTKKL